MSAPIKRKTGRAPGRNGGGPCCLGCLHYQGLTKGKETKYLI
jgi:hypothetical protein